MGGKQLPRRLESLNDRLVPLYDALDIPAGVTNRLFVGWVASETLTTSWQRKISRDGFRISLILALPHLVGAWSPS